MSYPFGRFKQENAWSKKIKDGYATVLAGSLSDDPDQGIVIVRFEHGKDFYETVIHAPQGGAVRILRAEGLRLVMETADGGLLYFDVPGERFTNSLTDVVPTSTGFLFEITPTPLP